jgi:thiol-disulfide isomerase/thioredoxin
MDDGPVPDFDLESADGTEFDSSKLIGHEPFVVAFFATWCDACERKLESLRRALTQSGEMLVIPVSVDGPEMHERVEDYLRTVGMGEPVVYASDYQRFAFSYNPFNTIPLLVIVGKNGGLVDYQLGYELEDEQRLVEALRLAQVIAPLAKPETPPN